MLYFGLVGFYSWDGYWQIGGSLLTLLVEKSGLVGVSAAILSLMALAMKGVVQKMPLFDFGRSEREAKIRREARREGMREGMKEGAQRLEREQLAWEAKQANGGTTQPRPTAETIDLS